MQPKGKILGAQGFDCLPEALSFVREAISSHRGCKQSGDKILFVFTKVPSTVVSIRVRRGGQVRKCKIRMPYSYQTTKSLRIILKSDKGAHF